MAAERLLNPPPPSDADLVLADLDEQLAHGSTCTVCGMANEVKAAREQMRCNSDPMRRAPAVPSTRWGQTRPRPQRIDAAAFDAAVADLAAILKPLFEVADAVAARRAVSGCKADS